MRMRLDSGATRCRSVGHRLHLLPAAPGLGRFGVYGWAHCLAAFWTMFECGLDWFVRRLVYFLFVVMCSVNRRCWLRAVCGEFCVRLASVCWFR